MEYQQHSHTRLLPKAEGGGIFGRRCCTHAILFCQYIISSTYYSLMTSWSDAEACNSVPSDRIQPAPSRLLLCIENMARIIRT